jgi:hypothetical protein
VHRGDGSFFLSTDRSRRRQFHSELLWNLALAVIESADESIDPEILSISSDIGEI